MKKIIDCLKEKMTEGFVAAGYDEKYAMVSVSNRPDLCQYQCNGAMAAAKEYKKAPIQIANDVVEKLSEDAAFEKIEAVNPGFINIIVSGELLAANAEQMDKEERFGVEIPEKPKTIVIDYGGPNVAKPLHVGHLRSAVIGESVKRICRFMGNKVIGDVHLGDWGLQIGLIITELKKRQPDLPYFDESFTGEYPKEAPFTISDLEEIYPYASGYSKEHEDYLKEAQGATALLQDGNRGYRALWEHVLNVSIADLKKNYDKLDVHFDLWKKESDVDGFWADLTWEEYISFLRREKTLLLAAQRVLFNTVMAFPASAFDFTLSEAEVDFPVARYDSAGMLHMAKLYSFENCISIVEFLMFRAERAYYPLWKKQRGPHYTWELYIVELLHSRREFVDPLSRAFRNALVQLDFLPAWQMIYPTIQEDAEIE